MNNPEKFPPPGERDNDTPLVLTGTAEYLETCSLVLSAVGISHTVNSGQPAISVAPQFAETAQRQIDQYFRENKGWPDRPVPVKMPASGETPPTLLMIGGLALFYLVTGPWENNSFWFKAGAIDSRAILEHGQWWRLVTALTLHADQVHLLGNCVIGGFIVHLLCKTMGSGLGWFSLVFCGALGNLLNILLRHEVHHSVGLSTSIFAAIGLFSGLQIFSANRIRLREFLLPLGAGAGLLAMLGTEGERTDLGAHFFGFACGIAFGFLLNRFDIHAITANRRLQHALFVLTLAVIVISWLAAWRTPV